MNRCIFTIVFLFFTISVHAQIVKQGEVFRQVSLMNEKVVFLKEITADEKVLVKSPYEILKEWIKKEYGQDTFYSSVRYDATRKEIIVKSRIELILPENSNKVREKMIMRYRMNAFIFHDKCVIELLDVAFIHENRRNEKAKLPRVIPGEDFISDKALTINDEFNELRTNTKRATLYFVNELLMDLESRFVAK